MKNTFKFLLFIKLFFFILFFSCSSDLNENFVFEENFESNKIGWVEENTQDHYVEILNGYYYIHSKDTASEQTSVSSFDNSYILNLKDTFSILLNMEYDKGKTGFGFLLRSPTLQYRFVVKKDGVIDVREYKMGDNFETILVSDSSYFGTLNKGAFFNFHLAVSDYDFKFFVNDIFVLEDSFRAKTWTDFRLLSERETAVKVNNLKIINYNQ